MSYLYKFLVVVFFMIPIIVFSQIEHDLINKRLNDKYLSMAINNNENKVKSNVAVKILDNGYLLTESIYQIWNTTEWKNVYKNIYTYDGDNLLEDIYSYWDGTNWVFQYKNVYLFEEGLKINDLFQTWNGSEWQDDKKSFFSYDGNNNLIEILVKDYTNSQWYDYRKEIYTYDSNGNLLDHIKQQYYNLTWMNDEKFANTYDSNYNVIVSEWLKWDGVSWMNYSYGEISYDMNNNKIQSVGYFWMGTEWVYTSKRNYNYDSSNQEIESVWLDWDDSVWVNSRKYSYDYNSYKLIYELRADWMNNEWSNIIYQRTYSYDENENLVENLQEDWDGSNWQKEHRTINTYSSLVGIENSENISQKYSLSNNYPNPFNPTTRISYSTPSSGNVNLKVFDLLGSEVAELVNGKVEAGDHEINFDASNLPSGIYFYRLVIGNFAETKRMLLLK